MIDALDFAARNPSTYTHAALVTIAKASQADVFSPQACRIA